MSVWTVRGKSWELFVYLGEDPNYQHIYEGNWLNDEPYGVIHRLATNGKRKGVSDACLNWCFEQWGNIRVDTHQDNKVMQHILTNTAFSAAALLCEERNRTYCLSEKTY